MNTFEYIWLDGYQPEPFMRSKVKATDQDTAPDWSFDGSSTETVEKSGRHRPFQRHGRIGC